MDALFEKGILEPVSPTVHSAIMIDKRNKIKKYQDVSRELGLID